MLLSTFAIACGGGEESIPSDDQDTGMEVSGDETAIDAGEAGDETSTEAGDETSTEAGDETSTEAGDETAIDAADAADETSTDAPDGDAPPADGEAGALPTLSIDDVVVTEGNTGTSEATFTVSLSSASTNPVTVAWATSDGTAVAGADYVSGAGTLTFAAGTTSQTVKVTINGDALDENDETFKVTLSSPTEATIAKAEGTGTITDDDAQPTLSIDDVSVSEGNSGTATAKFTVTLSAASGLPVTVAFASADGTATTAGSDYVAASGTLTFPAGTTTQTIDVTVNGDVLNETNETFALNLSSPTNATLSKGVGTGTITNDDTAPTLSIDDVNVTEGNSGTKTATFTVTLSSASGATTTASYATSDGTATAGSDYVAIPTGTLTFAAGETIKSVVVTLNGDTTAEADETFNVTLSSPTNATLAKATGVGTIGNDDGAVIPSLSINDVTVTEGNSGTKTATFTVTLSSAATGTVTVAYATSDGTATAGPTAADYVANTGTLTFAPGETSKTIAVTVNGDTLYEASETFSVTLSAPTGATLGTSKGTGTITNDDTAPTISISDVTSTEGAAGIKAFTFTITLSAAAGLPVTVNFASADGTATAAGSASSGGTDYTSASGTLTFAAGATAQAVSVLVNGDTLNEADETFVVNLSAPVNATIADGQGTGTITNDDPLPSIVINNVGRGEGNSGTSAFVFAVTLSAPSGRAVTVNYATADNGATAGTDYTAASGTITFAPGTTTQSITVLVSGDTTIEPNEQFLVNLSGAVSATIADPQGIGLIFNDDGAPTLSINDVTVTEGNGGTTTATFTVTLSASMPGTVTVNYATSNGTAIAGSDYTAATGTLTFAPGTTSQTVTVTVTGDTLDENNEFFWVNLSGATGGATIADAQGWCQINDDDASPALSIGDVTITEGNSGTTVATATVTLSSVSGRTVFVNYSTGANTAVPTGVLATGGQDYVTTSGTLTFAPGETTKTVTVTINGDTLNEANETFFVNLSGAANATIADNQAVVTINNDDAVPSLSINDVSQVEGSAGIWTTTNFTFTVTLSAASGRTVTVNWATANGTAGAPGDFVFASGTLTFAPGATTQTLTVQVRQDGLNESNETFSVNLSAATNATISDGTGQGTIVNDD
ncbi:MAG: hypothetical protein HYV09_15865 [Deltaproteobacteria bacterium]|nr:hypothetical protein [Deltaproteobacteria bacterium]